MGLNMLELFRRLCRPALSDLRSRTIGVYIILIAANIAAWLWAMVLFQDRPICWGPR